MIVLIKEEGDKNMSNTICQRFIDQKQVSTDKLLYSAGRVECGYRRDYFTVADEQIGAKETFSVGQPVYDVDNNLMGYLKIGLYENLDYSNSYNGEEIPVESWEIGNPTKHCISGKQIITFWQRWDKEIPKATRVISGFPGVGKTVFCSRSKYEAKVLDSDSNRFNWICEGVRNPEFPQNYIGYIKENIGVVDVILVSSHAVVRKALEENGIKYELVYPNIKLKEGYLERYRQRGNEQTFIDMMNTNWGKFIKEIKKETFPTLVELQGGQYLDSIF